MVAEGMAGRGVARQWGPKTSTGRTPGTGRKAVYVGATKTSDTFSESSRAIYSLKGFPSNSTWKAESPLICLNTTIIYRVCLSHSGLCLGPGKWQYSFAFKFSLRLVFLLKIRRKDTMVGAKETRPGVWGHGSKASLTPK